MHSNSTYEKAFRKASKGIQEQAPVKQQKANGKKWERVNTKREVL